MPTAMSGEWDDELSAASAAFIGMACVFVWILLLPFEIVSRLIKGDER